MKDQIYLDFSDVLIRPGFSYENITRADVNIMYNNRLPIIVSNIVSTGTFKMAELSAAHNATVFLSKEYTLEDYQENLIGLNHNLIGITTGVRKRDLEKTKKIIEMFPNIGFVNIDIANVGAQINSIKDAIKHIKTFFKGTLVAGNVATPELAVLLESFGADIIKVGIGSGSACLTRTEVGVGVPQLSAILEIAKAVAIPIISDGGCVTPGDVSKAIAAGAKYVMLGGMFSGCEELASEGYVDFYGLGSAKMYDKYSPQDVEYRPTEGRSLKVPVTTTVDKVFTQLKGALRSTCSYVGVNDISKLNDAAEFIRVNNIVNNSLSKYE
jgi:GMP reductase